MAYVLIHVFSLPNVKRNNSKCKNTNVVKFINQSNQNKFAFLFKYLKRQQSKYVQFIQRFSAKFLNKRLFKMFGLWSKSLEGGTNLARVWYETLCNAFIKKTIIIQLNSLKWRLDYVQCTMFMYTSYADLERGREVLWKINFFF